jgi:putative hydrolase of the HAD superfamily
MEEVINCLVDECELVLLSDHAAEWIDYIQTIHPLLGKFKHQFYSFQLGQMKREPSTFQRVLDAIGRAPESCIFVDDREDNVLAATAIGIPGVRFISSQQLSRDLAFRGLCTGRDAHSV